MSRKSWLNFIAMSLLWGLPYLLIKVAVAPGEFTPAFVVFGRVFIGAALLIPYCLHKGILKPAFKYLPWIALYALLEICGPWLLISTAETKIASGLSGLLVATVPFWAAIVMSFLGDKSVWHSTRLAGMIVGFIGVVLVVGIESIKGHQNFGAIAMILLATLGYTTAPTMMVRKAPELKGTAVNAIAMGISALIYLPIAIKDFPSHAPSGHAIESLVALAIFPTTIAFTLFFALIADIGIARASMVTYPNTAIAVVLGIIFLHEPLTVGIIIGLPLVLVGSYFASRKGAAAH